MLHQMKLFENPFEKIKNGTKTIEFRLYDEKRQNLRVGDKIEFSKLPDLKEKITVKVLGLYSSKKFKELFERFFDAVVFPPEEKENETVESLQLNKSDTSKQSNCC